MNKHWPNCIVSVIDVIGIKQIAKAGGSKASSQMLKLHSLTQTAMNSGMHMHAHAYCWNDSVLLLAFWNGAYEAGRTILSEASELKRRIDEQVGKSYAISVKGRAFPQQTTSSPEEPYRTNDQPRCIILKASSYAFANCHLIEAEAKKKRFRASWYIDSRLKEAVDAPLNKSFLVDLLPTGKSRKIFRLHGYPSQP